MEIALSSTNSFSLSLSHVWFSSFYPSSAAGGAVIIVRIATFPPSASFSLGLDIPGRFISCSICWGNSCLQAASFRNDQLDSQQ